MGLVARKNCLRRFANNNGADQPAHSSSLISAFEIRFIESSISKPTTSEISVQATSNGSDQTARMRRPV